MDSIIEGRRTVERLKRRWMNGWLDGWCSGRYEEDGEPKVVDSRQGLRVVAKSSTGSQGSQWAVALLLMKFP
jgi:hypothetical protein